MTIEIYADANRGVYIPQFFAQTVKRELLRGVESSDLEILEAGPDHESYWDAWASVLDNAEIVTEAGESLVLYQDDDLFVGTPDELQTAFSDY